MFPKQYRKSKREGEREINNKEERKSVVREALITLGYLESA